MAALEKLRGLALARHTLDRVTERRREPAFVEALWADPRARVLVVVHGEAALDGEALVYSSPADLPATTDRYLLGIDADDVPYFATPSDTVPETVPDGARMLGLRDVGVLLDDRDAGAFVHALALANWHVAHPFCARCGAATTSCDGGHVRRCPSCGAEHFPRTDPAIIVLVTDDDDRALLGRGVNWPVGRFSTLAGFVEPGESLEAAVIREVHEESGVVVTDPTYVGSQPWPFPSSLMLGFFASATATEINVDKTEIAEARWFSREDLRKAYATGEVKPPSGVSIARRLVEMWYGSEL